MQEIHSKIEFPGVNWFTNSIRFRWRDIDISRNWAFAKCLCSWTVDCPLCFVWRRMFIQNFALLVHTNVVLLVFSICWQNRVVAWSYFAKMPWVLRIDSFLCTAIRTRNADGSRNRASTPLRSKNFSTQVTSPLWSILRDIFRSESARSACEWLLRWATNALTSWIFKTDMELQVWVGSQLLKKAKHLLHVTGRITSFRSGATRMPMLFLSTAVVNGNGFQLEWADPAREREETKQWMVVTGLQKY